jgi:hypothetical protein
VFPLDQGGLTKQATLSVIADGLPSATGTGGLVRQSSPNFTGNTRITDGAYPFYELYNTAAPTDKKRFRAYVDTFGNVGLARTNDAETVGTNLLSWDTANTANFSFPVAITTANATLATFSGSPGPGGFTGIRVQCADASAAAVKIAFFDFANETGANVASLWTGFETDGSTNLRFLTTPAGSRSGDRRVERVRITGDGNVGIGTNTPAARLHVRSGAIRVDNNEAIQWTDTGGSTPYWACQTDNNFALYGTTSAGAVRGIFDILVRNDTSALRVLAPLQIGASGSPIQNVITTTFNHTPAAIAANGGVQTLDVTLTGATAAGVTLIECPAGVSNNAIVLKANYISANTVRVYWINPTAASVALSNANYRVAVINF